MIKLQTNNRTAIVVSAYASQQGRFYENFIQLIAGINEKDMIIIGGELHGHATKEVDGYDSAHGCYGFGVRNTEDECVLKMGTALDMVVCNTWSKKRESRLFCLLSRVSRLYSSGACKTQINYILVRNKDRKLVKDVKVVPSEEVVLQHCIVVPDIKPCKTLQSIKTAFY